MSKLKFYQQSFHAMGTACEIQLFAKDLKQAKQAAANVIQDVNRLESRYSRYRNDSYLSAINQVAFQGGSLSVDDETAGLLNYAQACYQQSNGLFDITSGILRRCWDFKSGKLPEPAQVQSLLDNVGWHKLLWHPPVLEFPLPGMEVDFGGIVKEYAVDRAAVLCWQAGIRHGVVNLGGDIKIIGPRADGGPWRIGIRDPRDKNQLIDTLLLTSGALASSGDYERCIVLDDVRYGHILNPKTGWPVCRLAAVSVVADFCVVAGSAATIAMLKEAEGPAWLAELGVPHIWVDVDGQSAAQHIGKRNNKVS